MKRILLILTMLFAVCLYAATKLTNVTLDAEGTGNTITIPVKAWFPAASCQNSSSSSNWDMFTTSIPTSICVNGTNVVKGFLRYPVNTQDAAQFTYLLPSDLSGLIDIKIVWTTATVSGTAQFAVDEVCSTVGSTSTDDTVFSSLWAPSAFTASSTAGAINGNFTTGVTNLCVPGQMMHLRVKRVDTAGTATNADVYGLELTYRRAM